MRMNEVDFDDNQPIDGYGPGFFRIGGEIYGGAVLLAANRAEAWSGYDNIAAIVTLKEQIDFLLIGTGSEIAHPPAEFRRTLEGAGIGLEVMATPAACRTYNVLLAEGRRVGAALLPVQAKG